MSKPWLKRSFLTILVVVIYFIAIRPVREMVNYWQVKYIYVSDEVAQKVQFSYAPTSIRFLYQLEEDQVISGSHKIPFGRYFLLATIGIFLLGIAIKYFYTLLLIHGISFIIQNIFFYAGLYIYMPLLIGVDLFSEYLIPLISFLVLVLGFIHKKESKN